MKRLPISLVQILPPGLAAISRPGEHSHPTEDTAKARPWHQPALGKDKRRKEGKKGERKQARHACSITEIAPLHDLTLYPPQTHTREALASRTSTHKL